ncbi:UPF0481 protein At3g47200-like isoform X2 [Rhododendron vialii]|uniref:UPF0481 protein At3g47200-like isoform X2 n=1 Tax=Rhododendron vialii TaxID=182163 RepID=UPI00265EC377|nr:UPF0481 protein At3g47200-like isoform X2 [Rhododendron vialii]
MILVFYCILNCEPSIYRWPGSVFCSNPNRKSKTIITQTSPTKYITQQLLYFIDQMETHPTEMNQGENDYEKDLKHLTSTIAGKISEGAEKAEYFFSSACIFRVPEDLRKLNERAYTPRLIAIGPLHREDKHLQTPLQHVKPSYTNCLLSRLAVGMEDRELAVQTILMVLQKCLAEMKTSIDNAKKCYAEEVMLNEEMMLVDGCFILEFLYRCRTQEVQERDPIFCNSFTFCKVQKDLVLLENQIPFFVLEKLFRLIVDHIPNRIDNNWSLPDYLGWCYNEWMSPLPNSDNSSSSSAKTWYCSPRDCVLRVFRCTTAAEKEEVQSGNTIDHHRSTAKYSHILHNLHEGCLPHDQTKQKNFSFREMPPASELVYAGIKFVPDAGNDLFKFKFSEPKGLFWWCRRACFEIPPLLICDETESYLRNLIALEQCCPGVSWHVSSYADIMDMLVKSDNDIQVLEKAGVLTNCLGPTGDATNLFNKLCKEIMVGQYFRDTCSKATEYSKRFWPKNMAHVRRTYFDSPWTFIAFFVGFIAFVITLVGFARSFGKKC